MLDRVRIRTLREAGHTLQEIAASVGVAKRSVQNVLKEPPITSPKAAPTPRSRGIGAPSTVRSYQGDVERILQQEPSLPTVEVLSRLRGLGYHGGKSAVYELVKAIRPPRSESPEVRFEGVPGEFSQHGFGVKLCWPRCANQKGSVENLVGWGKGSFFKVRRFHDREDLERQLIAWLEEMNTQRPSRATNEIPAERMSAERQRLSPLAIPAAEYPLRITTMVRTTGFVEYERIRYSMPPKTIGIPGTLLLYPDRVRIVTRDGTEVEHPRRPAVGNTLYRSEDRVAKLAAVHGERAKLYQKRQEILELGPSAEALMTEWVHHPRMNWKSQVEALHVLLIRHGPQRTLGAIERALCNGARHVKAISWVLDREAK